MTLDSLKIQLPEQPTFAQLSGFSHPYGPIDQTILEASAVRMARHVVGLFVSRNASTLQQRGSSDLAELLERWLSMPTTYETVWDDSFGRLRAALTGPPDVVFVPEAAAAVGSRLCATGMPARFGVTFDHPSRQSFASWLLPPASKLHFESDGNEVSIALGGGERDGTLRFRRAGARWDLSSSDLHAALSPMPIVEVESNGRRVQVLQRDALFSFAMGDLEQIIPDVIDDGVRASVQEGLDILRDHASVYAGWVGRHLRRIVPLFTRPGLMMSSSSIYRPGTITMSHNAHPIGMAEMLVHEHTHEYLYLAGAFGPIDDGSDPKMYYSPIRKIDRPIAAIVVGYHAVGNIALLYRECRRSGLDGADYLDASEEEALGWLAEMDGILSNTGSLTTIGRALWEPLREHFR